MWLSFLSVIHKLGDVFCTGIAFGVSLGKKKDGRVAIVYLKPSGMMKLETEGYGEHLHKVVSFKTLQVLCTR